MPESVMKPSEEVQRASTATNGTVENKRVSLAASAGGGELNRKTVSSKTGIAPTAEGAAPANGNGEKKKKKRTSSIRKNQAKMRVRLPPIESYERELEFPADAPGRVVVRLERLMGTDRVRITDAKYMGTLLKRLEEDEQVQWLKRSKLRKQAERNRHRQLAIEGHMEPGPDMMDLYNHPVFRVNRILNRLSKLDNEISATSVTRKPPPLTPVEPFEEYDRTGILFGFHPGHYKLTMPEEVPESKLAAQEPEEVDELFNLRYLKASAREEQRQSTASFSTRQSETVMARPKSPKLRYKTNEWGGEDYGEEEEETDVELELDEYISKKNLDKEDVSSEETETGDEDNEEEGEGEESGKPSEPCEIKMLRNLSLSNAKKKYGIRQDVNLESLWRPYRSPLVDIVYDEANESAPEMFSTARDLLETYQREVKSAENFYTKYARMFR